MSSFIHFYDSIQTLTTLSLDRNEIGIEGAQHLAEALKKNTVKKAFFFHFIFTIIFQCRH